MLIEQGPFRNGWLSPVNTASLHDSDDGCFFNSSAPRLRCTTKPKQLNCCHFLYELEPLRCGKGASAHRRMGTWSMQTKFERKPVRIQDTDTKIKLQLTLRKLDMREETRFICFQTLLIPCIIPHNIHNTRHPWLNFMAMCLVFFVTHVIVFYINVCIL